MDIFLLVIANSIVNIMLFILFFRTSHKYGVLIYYMLIFVYKKKKNILTLRCAAPLASAFEFIIFFFCARRVVTPVLVGY